MGFVKFLPLDHDAGVGDLCKFVDIVIEQVEREIIGKSVVGEEDAL